ncbi:CopM family metallochaperone [Azospirillum palustre]
MAHRIRNTIVPLALATALIAGPATAQQTQPAPQGQTTAPMGSPGVGGPGMGANQGMMQGQGMHQGQRAQNMPKDPASHAYMQSMQKMNRDMRSKRMTGDADADFARMMAAHHQGAIDMARVELQYGKDPDLKAMAQKMVDDQTKEVQQLQDWLKQHPTKQSSNK